MVFGFLACVNSFSLLVNNLLVVSSYCWYWLQLILKLFSRLLVLSVGVYGMHLHLWACNAKTPCSTSGDRTACSTGVLSNLTQLLMISATDFVTAVHPIRYSLVQTGRPQNAWMGDSALLQTGLVRELSAGGAAGGRGAGFSWAVLAACSEEWGSAPPKEQTLSAVGIWCISA